MEQKVKTPKDLIAEGEIKGGIVQEGVKQHYRINYLPAFEDYEAKLEVALLLLKEGDGQVIQSYRSLRFNNSAQIRMFVLNVIKAYFYWMKKLDQVRPDNFDFKLDRFLDNISEILRHPERFE